MPTTILGSRRFVVAGSQRHTVWRVSVYPVPQRFRDFPSPHAVENVAQSLGVWQVADESYSRYQLPGIEQCRQFCDYCGDVVKLADRFGEPHQIDDGCLWGRHAHQSCGRLYILSDCGSNELAGEESNLPVTETEIFPVWPRLPVGGRLETRGTRMRECRNY